MANAPARRSARLEGGAAAGGGAAPSLFFSLSPLFAGGSHAALWSLLSCGYRDAWVRVLRMPPNSPMKLPRTLSALLPIVRFLAIPLLGPDGTFPMCLKDGRPVECEKWKILAKFASYDDCFKVQMDTRGRAQW